MTGQDLVRRFFGENSRAWVEASYQGDGYGFPSAYARFRKTAAILAQQFPNCDAKIADLGCGAGQLCLKLARKGFQVVGVDESEPMLAQGLRELASLAKEVQSRVRFINRDLLDNGLDDSSCDSVISLGVIGYLPDDDVLFKEAARLLRPGGIFILSCRNRLFNMVSLSDYTLREIDQGSAKELVQEIRELFQRIPNGDALRFVTNLASIAENLMSELAQDPVEQPLPATASFTTSIEARQHTPKQILETASLQGFKHEEFYGVHPHLMMAGLNHSFPANTYNPLSSSLDTLDHLPVSLIWSSVFIGVFHKTS